MSSAARKLDLIGRNRLAKLLFRQDDYALSRDLVPVSLPRDKELYPDDEGIDAIYFPLDCVVSVLSPNVDGKHDVAEVAIIGHEGGVGVLSHVSADRAIGRHVVQIPGDALRCEVGRFDDYLNEKEGAWTIVNRYIYALITQINVSAACAQTHGIQPRCAGKLLAILDRVGRPSFDLTQELLARMLSVRRATVTEATAALKASGAIHYTRGQMTVADRGRLEAAACPCYEKIRRTYAQFELA